MQILWRKLEPSIPKDRHNTSQFLLRAGIILIMGGISAAVPKLEPFIGLVGAVFFSVLGNSLKFLVKKKEEKKNSKFLLFE